jgi:CRP-like cAMP-binding protein
MKTDALAMLSPRDWTLLEKQMKPVSYRRGDVVIEEGGHRRALFIVRSGAVRVDREDRGSAITVAQLGPDELLGEMGFVENEPASAAVVAQDDSVIDVIEWDGLQSVMASEPGFAVRFYHSLSILLARRLRSTSKRLAQTGAGEAAQVNRFRVARTGNISARQVPQDLRQAIDAFERTMLDAKQALRSEAAAEATTAKVSAACDEVVDLLGRFTHSNPIVDMGYTDLLSFRDTDQLEAGVGDYIFRQTFPTLMLSSVMARCYAKPLGFPDDRETMAAIYRDAPEGDDYLGPLIDRWFLGRPLCRSRRASRDLMGSTLQRLVEAQPSGQPVRIASLASGVASELVDVMRADAAGRVFATAVDLDGEALHALGGRLAGSPAQERVTFMQGSAVPTDGEGVRLLPQTIIYALGLCEYLTDEQVGATLNAAFDALAPGGALVVSNLAAANPDGVLMEHLLDWKANHRTEADLAALFAASRFGDRAIELSHDEAGVTLFARALKSA